MANTTVAVLDDAAVHRNEPTWPAISRKLEDGLDLAVYDNLASVEAIWREFESTGDCTAFQTFEWLSAWQRQIGAKNGFTPVIVVARDQAGAILFILPFATHQSGIARELVWLGSELCDYNAPLLAKDFAHRLQPRQFVFVWQNVLQLLRASPPLRFDVIHLEKMPETVRSQRNPMLVLKTVLHPSGSYATPLAQSWETFYAAKRSSSTRSRDRAKRKRLAEYGKVEFVTAKTTREALDTIEVLAKQKSAYFARHGISNLFARPGYFDFLKDFVSSPGAARLAHISELRVGSQVVAANFALTLGGRYYYVLSSYTDGELSRLGPGAVHLQELLRYAIENLFTIFDFTVGDERYKLDWCDGTSALHDYVATVTVVGAAQMWPIVAFKALKRIIKQTPVLWACFTRLRRTLARLRSLGGTGAEAP